MTNEQKRGRLRWKRNPAETGLAAIGAAPRGWTLHDGVDEYAHVRPNGGGWQRRQNGWYWCAYDLVPHINTHDSPRQSPDECKAEAMAYVKAELAKAGTP